ncbi:beta-lactamase/transpeptidase-like protein [Dendrothele bispora CBS 962.96]|uniref:Beta-lactamase/transpeptidase-like protein n=1 Tax=Dendrothele bispora (strain CBS 962.96) TaxID=1314807 RepID=A0A4V4HIX9_DENBC|nr:beta-lactamase/transpeptidase-like protein [Dendrothele bispora CBS 962.96]
METLRQKLRVATGETDRSKQSIPPVILLAKNKSGSLNIKEKYGYVSAKPDAAPVDFDSTFWVASCTKLVTTVAALQLVEQGLVDLDEDITRVLHEWKDAKVLAGYNEKTGEPILRPAKTKMTLRHLLTHSSGMAYGILHESIQKYMKATNHVLKGQTLQDQSVFPLLFDPGEGWHYGFSIDWAGVVVERLSPYSCLGEYMENHIWSTLGMRNTAFRIQNRTDIKDRLVQLYQRNPDGSMIESQIGVYPGVYDGGGGGLFLQPTDYIKLLESLLKNDGKVLKPETRDMMFEPQLKDAKGLMNYIQSKDPKVLRNSLMCGTPHDTEVNWGLGGILMMQDVEGKRKKGTLSWAGYPNLFWWIDPTSEVCGFFANQILPPGEPIVAGLNSEWEYAVYDELRKLGSA